MAIPYQILVLKSGTNLKQVVSAGYTDAGINDWDPALVDVIVTPLVVPWDLRKWVVFWDIGAIGYVQGDAIVSESPAITAYLQNNQVVTDPVTGLVGPPVVMNALLNQRSISNKATNPLYDASLASVVNSLGVTHFPTMHRVRLPVTRLDIKTGRIGPGCCRSDDDTTNMCPSGNNDADLEASGAGGLDTGAEADSTHYHMWLIYDPDLDAYAAMWSLSSTAPEMPSGYTKKRRLDSFYNAYTGDSTASIILAESFDLKRLKFTYYEHREGLVYSGSDVNFKTVGLGIEVADTTRLVLLEYDCARANNLTGFRVAEYGKDSWAPTEVLGYGQIRGQVIVAISDDATRGFSYRVENAADVLTLWIRGYWKELD